MVALTNNNTANALELGIKLAQGIKNLSVIKEVYVWTESEIYLQRMGEKNLIPMF